MITMIPNILIIKIAEFDHVQFIQRGDSRDEAATIPHTLG